MTSILASLGTSASSAGSSRSISPMVGRSAAKSCVPIELNTNEAKNARLADMRYGR